MNILLVAATELEIHGLKRLLISSKHKIKYCISGVGILFSATLLSKVINKKYDLVIQIGIAGAFKKQIPIGETVFVRTDTLGDTGVENKNIFLDLVDLKFTTGNEMPFAHNTLTNPFESSFLKKITPVNAITVNTASGNISTIRQRIKKYNPDIESMEGAVLHYICLQRNIPFVQFRGISNFIEPRNTKNWKISTAIESLHKTTSEFINSLK